MKRIVNIISLILVSIIVLSLSSCKIIGISYGYSHPTYNSKFTSEQHKSLIKNIVEDDLYFAIENNQITNINVEILYSFYDYDPEFFLVEVDGKTWGHNPDWKEGDDEWDSSILKDFHGYIIGFINNDEYYQIGYHIGESPYRKLGYENNKKYFGQTSMGIEEDGVIYKIAELVRKEETITEKKAVTKEEEKNYMEKGGLQTRLVKANDLSALSVRIWKWGA